MEAATAALEDLSKKIDSIARAVANLPTTLPAPEAGEKKPENPGPFKIGKDTYECKFLEFRIPDAETGVVTTFTAKQLSEDKALAETILKMNPALFRQVIN